MGRAEASQQPAPRQQLFGGPRLAKHSVRESLDAARLAKGAQPVCVRAHARVKHEVVDGGGNRCSAVPVE
eukprot:CAMPEP_0171818114 /NCGR_PEP_ID=MMETSP0992-20121227/1472_1 /TAXON_ID=483369 /ORGANISM="non described non described, Strain CCMP2098" /LENGTH=69 /DNA_ID=CAMNT_0012432239 /DNA_START=371 /DNA_END=580 /DNA_ORIENTATION=+